MLRLWTGLIDGQIATVYRMAFQCADSSLTLVTIPHGDKSKSTGLTTHPIGYQVHVSDGTVRSEEVAQFAFASGERQIAYVYFHKTFFEDSHRAVPEYRVSNHH